jgi:methionyl-tRNA formyltransferase
VGQDNLIIKELQIEGKKRMDVKEFIAGHKICVGEILGTKK